MARGISTAFPTFVYRNTVSAINYGVEFELKSRFNFLDTLLGSRIFGDLTIFSNLAVIRSEVTPLKDIKVKRPLQGQSPYVFNLGLQYTSENHQFDVTCTYNRIGPRVAFSSFATDGSIWEMSRDIVDIAIGKTFKKFNFKLIFGDIFQQELVQFIVWDRGGRKEDNPGVLKWISNTPNYQKGQDIPFFRYTHERTVRVSGGWKL